MRNLTIAALALILFVVVAAPRPFGRTPCPDPPPPAANDVYQAVSMPRSSINAATATLHSSGRFIAMVPDDSQPGCYILTYYQNF